MKNKLLSIVLIALFTACKTQTYVDSNTNWNYAKFREDQKTFKSADGNIKYIDKGKGKVILLLHGVPTSSWLYRKMIDGLVKNGNRVIAPDMLGYGNSDNPEGYEIYSQEQHAKRILDLMNSLKINEWTHVIHDAGGLWTWELIEKAPEKIQKLVLLNTIIYEEGFNPPIRMKRGTFAKTSMALYRNGITTNFLLKKLFKDGLKDGKLHKNDIEGYKRPLREKKTNGMYYFFTQTCNTFPDYSSTFSKIDIPVLVIWGKHDNTLQWEPQKEKVIKRLKVKPKNIHLLDAKHFIQEEKPNKINELIINFLQ